MKKKLIKGITVLCLATLTLVNFGCSDKESQEKEQKKPEVKWEVPIDEDGLLNKTAFDIETSSYHITSAVQIEDGVARALTKTDFLQTTTEETEGSQIHSPGNDGIFEPKSLTKKLSKDDATRITQVFEQSMLINLKGEMSLERTMMENGGLPEEDIDQTSIDEIITNTYALKTKGISYTSINSYEGLVPSDDYKYAAILFVPKVAVVIGEYKSYQLTYQYPCVDNSGFLEGMFLMVQSNNIQDIPN